MVLDRNTETKDVPFVAGIGASSTRETIALARDAAIAGADFVMAIPPGYYATALKADDMAGVKKFMVDVSEGSPFPLFDSFYVLDAQGIDSEHSGLSTTSPPYLLGSI